MNGRKGYHRDEQSVDSEWLDHRYKKVGELGDKRTKSKRKVGQW
jgi:hypothetical protein